MKTAPRVGDVGEQRFVVSQQHLIDFADDVMPAVLCTPKLIHFLEHAAREALLPLMDENERCVGVEVNVEHTAPTPPGEEVVCRARVIYVDGPLISFQVEAHDEHERIAHGTHKRRVIDARRLAKRVQSKATGN